MLSGLSPVLAFLAGVLTILSPCVLPLVPIVFANAQSRHALGPLALGSGLALSFTVVGIFIATIGYSVGLDPDVIRIVGATLLVALGAMLVVPTLLHRFESVAAPIGAFAQRMMPDDNGGGLGRQFLIGSLLGLVWLPCVGPTLGAAFVLASQRHDLAGAVAVMLAFAVGAALPLAIIGTICAKASANRRRMMTMVGARGRVILGAALAIAGMLILTRVDRRIEAVLTAASPDWLIAVTTRY